MENGPVDLVLVRHGESEGNLAQYRSKNGVEDDWKGEFGERHSSRYRLTDEGRRQAKCTGEFIKENIFSSFDMYVQTNANDQNSYRTQKGTIPLNMLVLWRLLVYWAWEMQIGM